MTKSIKLVTVSGAQFEFDVKWLNKTAMLTSMLENLDFDVQCDQLPQTPVPLPFEVDDKSLQLVLRWCKQHEEEEPRSEDAMRVDKFVPVERQDADLLKTLEDSTALAQFFRVANYLEMPDLGDTIAKFIAGEITALNDEQKVSEWLKIPLKKTDDSE